MKKPSRRPTRVKKELSSEQLAVTCARAARDMKALDLVVIEVGGLVYYCDYFVIAGARSSRQAQSIAENVQRAIVSSGEKVVGVEGEKDGNWVLVDGGEVVIHVFYQPVREFYDLERLWGDAKRIELPEPGEKN